MLHPPQCQFRYHPFVNICESSLVEKARHENPQFQSSASTKFDDYCLFITLKLFPFSNLLMQTKKITFNSI